MPRKILNIDELAEMFKLMPWDKIDEANLDYYWECAKGIEGEEEQNKAQDEARDELFYQWYDAVLHAAETLFDRHELRLVPRKKGERSYEYIVLPKTTWRAAAEAIRETINGVGYFHFNSVKEFCLSIPTNVRGVVIDHLHWLTRQPAVYGDTSAERLYEQHWR